MKQCIYCESKHLNKNGQRRGKQCFWCRTCGRQFLESYEIKGYHPVIKEQCLKLHARGLGYREIERATGVNHNTVINWVKELGHHTPSLSHQHIRKTLQGEKVLSYLEVDR